MIYRNLQHRVAACWCAMLTVALAIAACDGQVVVAGGDDGARKRVAEPGEDCVYCGDIIGYGGFLKSPMCTAEAEALYDALLDCMCPICVTPPTENPSHPVGPCGDPGSPGPPDACTGDRMDGSNCPGCAAEHCYDAFYACVLDKWDDPCERFPGYFCQDEN
jgi:hypothetical protein